MRVLMFFMLPCLFLACGTNPANISHLTSDKTLAIVLKNYEIHTCKEHCLDDVLVQEKYKSVLTGEEEVWEECHLDRLAFECKDIHLGTRYLVSPQEWQQAVKKAFGWYSHQTVFSYLGQHQHQCKKFNSVVKCENDFKVLEVLKRFHREKVLGEIK